MGRTQKKRREDLPPLPPLLDRDLKSKPCRGEGEKKGRETFHQPPLGGQQREEISPEKGGETLIREREGKGGGLPFFYHQSKECRRSY